MSKSVTVAALLAFSLQLAAPNLVMAQDATDTAQNLSVVASTAPMLSGSAQETRNTADEPRSDAQTTDQATIIVDNDEEKDKENTVYQWKEIPDTDGKTKIESGARFPVCIVSAHSSKTAKVGDPVEARLKIDIKIGGRLIAAKGATVSGHIATCQGARKMIKAEFSGKHWMRPSGTLGLQFDEIVTESGQHLPLVAQPAKQAQIVENKGQGRLLGVNSHGEIALPTSYQVKRQMVQLAIRAGASAAGAFSFGAVPVAFGVLGAINPSFAFMHPVGTNVRHRRLKGFGMGVISGLPGGFLLADSINRGEEAVIQPGDVFLAEFKQNFTGEASSEAQLAPDVKTGVHGQVLPGHNG